MMLLLIRHGPAGDREAWRALGKDDFLRPLTADGRARTRAIRCRASFWLGDSCPRMALSTRSPPCASRSQMALFFLRPSKGRSCSSRVAIAALASTR